MLRPDPSQHLRLGADPFKEAITPKKGLLVAAFLTCCFSLERNKFRQSINHIITMSDPFYRQHPSLLSLPLSPLSASLL